jgi:hypothetical protein
VAVRTVLVCARVAQCVRQCVAVRLVVCELYVNLAVWSSVAVCGSACCRVRKCARQGASVCESALAVHGSAHVSVRAVRSSLNYSSKRLIINDK